MSITIKVERTLDHQFVSDVLITAFDGQYGECWRLWAAPHYIKTPTATATWLQTDKDANGEDYWLACHVTWNDENAADVVDKPGSVTGSPAVDVAVHNGVCVDAYAVRLGIQRILDGDAGVASSSAVRHAVMEAVAEGDAGQIDADAADCIIQAGVFGKVVFS